MPRRAGCPIVLAALVCLLVQNSEATATDTEHRDFVIFVDGKEAGQSRITIVQQDDGAIFVSAGAKVTVKHLLGAYNYSVDAQEWWKADKLVGLKAQVLENGKKTEVVVGSSGEQFRLTVNGQEKKVRSDSWTNSFWKLADARYHNKQVPVLEVDTGKEYTASLVFVANEQLKVGNQTQDCYRFRVKAPEATTEVWFDRYHRLVRQEFTESGHRTIVQLLSIRR